VPARTSHALTLIVMRASDIDTTRATILVDRRETDYVGEAQAEARRATRLLRTALGRAGHPNSQTRATVRPMRAVVGARLLDRGLHGGVLVATPAT
jgi:hypothetical protein